MVNTYSDVINSEAGLISSCVYRIPNRPFMPVGLYLTAVQGENLDILDCNFPKIKAGGIGFSLEHSVASSLGEFCERYSSAIINKKRIVVASYQELSKKGKKALYPGNIKLFADWQYENSDFPFVKLRLTDELPWVECQDYMTGETIYIPNFLVYFGKSAIDSKYAYQTSTGLACGPDFHSAFRSAVFENFERHAFVDFWYNQQGAQFLKYSKDQVLQAFPHNKYIQRLYNNNNVHIATFDLTRHSGVETIIVFMYFKFKGKYHQSMGSASRFTKEDALVKAMLEAYQGVEYAIGLDKDNILGNVAENELNKINDFETHFAYYNTFPHLRQQVPILKAALEDGGYAPSIVFEEDKLKTFEKTSFQQHGISQVYFIDVTTSDVAELGNKVVRVIMPELALLSAMHAYPFLGNAIFKDKKTFNTYPHPFP